MLVLCLSARSSRVRSMNRETRNTAFVNCFVHHVPTFQLQDEADVAPVEVVTSVEEVAVVRYESREGQARHSQLSSATSSMVVTISTEVTKAPSCNCKIDKPTKEVTNVVLWIHSLPQKPSPRWRPPPSRRRRLRPAIAK